MRADFRMVAPAPRDAARAERAAQRARRARIRTGLLATLLAMLLIATPQTMAGVEAMATTASQPTAVAEPTPTPTPDATTTQTTDPAATLGATAPTESTAPAESIAPAETTAPTETTAPAPTESAAPMPTLTPRLSVSPMLVAPMAVTAANRTVSCSPGTFYSVLENGTLRQVVDSGSTATVTTVSSALYTGATPRINGLGISYGGQAVYAFERYNNGTSDSGMRLIRYDATSGQKTSLMAITYWSGIKLDLIAGAVDPSTGIYYFGGYSSYYSSGYYYLTFEIYKIDPNATNPWPTYVGSIRTGVSKYYYDFARDEANGDIVFDQSGNLYVLYSSSVSTSGTANVRMFTVSRTTLLNPPDPNYYYMRTSGTETFTLTNQTAGDVANGLAVDADGTIILGTTKNAYRYDPATWTRLETITLSLQDGSGRISTDLSSCQAVPTLTVTKNIVGRAQDADQFFLSATAPGASSPFAVATTEGTGTGTQVEQIGPVIVRSGNTYTLREAMASGSASTLTDYSSSYVCTSTTSTGTTTQLASGTGTQVAVTIPTTGAPSVHCEFTNSPKADITVTKRWIVNGVAYPHGQQPSGLDATLTLTGPGTAGASAQPWGTTRTGYALGNTPTIDEKVTIPPQFVGCTLDSKQVTKLNGATVTGQGLPFTTTLTQAKTTIEVTNTLTCNASLTLVKQVSYGDAAPAVWTLSATPATGTAVTGASGVSGVVAPNVDYSLAETNGPAAYIQQGEWQCATATGRDAAGQLVYGAPVAASGAKVHVPYAGATVCTVTNATAKLTVLKHVINDDNGDLDDAAWNLTTTPAGGVAGLATSAFAGAEQPAAANTQYVRPGHPYSLTEAGPASAAYFNTKVQRYLGDPTKPVNHDDAALWTDIAPNDLTVAAGAHTIVRLVNDDAPAIPLPLTGAFAGSLPVIGIASALAALAATTWFTMRRRRTYDGAHGLLDS